MREEDEYEVATPVRVPFSYVLASAVCLWVCYLVLATLRAELVDLGFTYELLWRRILVAVAAIVATIAMWLVLRLFDTRSLWLKIAAALFVAAPVSLAVAQANQMAFADMQERIVTRLAEAEGVQVRRDESGNLLVDIALPWMNIDRDRIETGPDGQPQYRLLTGTDSYSTLQLSDIALGRYFLMLAWCALYFAMVAGEQARAAERREGAFRRAAKAAELRSLRYQVNPHFLFNTLNSLSALVLTGKTERAEAMIQTISTFYRRSLADDPTTDVPLAEEFKLQQLYLDIEAVRFPERLVAKFELPEELEGAKVPGMILQPLVENSVKHAVAPTSGKVTITVSAREDFGRLVITVSDDGKCKGGATKSKLHKGHGIGLANVRERLEARFGEQASITSGKSDGGYTTQIRIPLIT
jgi:hypothetical protein